MALRHIEKYLENKIGCTRREVQRILEDRRNRYNEELFKASSLEKYYWKKNNNMLRGEF